MNELPLFVIGIVVFAITVYGSVMAGGLLLTKQVEAENSVAPPASPVPPATERPAL